MSEKDEPVLPRLHGAGMFARGFVELVGHGLVGSTHVAMNTLAGRQSRAGEDYRRTVRAILDAARVAARGSELLAFGRATTERRQ